MDKTVERNIIASYQTSGGFIVHDCEMLRRIYKALNINPQESLDNRIYELEGITHFFQRGVIALANKLGVTANDYILNPGEGSGAPSRLLAKLFKCRVVGIDVNPDQVNKARELAFLHGVQNKVEYYKENINEISLNKTDFSKAFVSETCVHWHKKEIAFKKIFQHLRRGAKIGFNLWLKGCEGTLNDAYNFIPEFRSLYKTGIWFQDDLDTYRHLLESSGFALLEAFDCTDKIDIKIRARLAAAKQWEIYEKLMSFDAKENGMNYYKGMLKTHYRFLKYGVIVAEKI
ncbi:MAG: methyltransferase domain-containing protein [Candidatus Omnitrophica bacterium]|jgi:SAM-dependent methyltransferase|nr:methyltransferase domain-containing protein [Candidatus Omnitrophota bacterium]